MNEQTCPLRRYIGPVPIRVPHLSRATIEHAIVTCLAEEPELRHCTCLTDDMFSFAAYRAAFRACTADALLPDEADAPTTSAAFHAYVDALRASAW